jgi:hypothetical protein
MFQPQSHIEIGKWAFDYMVSITIDQSIETLTDTCKITIPRKFTWEGKQVAMGDDPLLKVGDQVTVDLGYDGNLLREFTGYLRTIKSGVPVSLSADDSMWMLKKGSITKNYSKVNLKELLTDILPEGMSFQVPLGEKEVSLGQFRISKASPANILDELKNTYGLYSYFRNIDGKQVLYCGLAYWTDHRTEHKFRMGETGNIVNYDNLEFRNAEDIRLKIKATSILPDNSRIEVEVGDSDGEVRTVFQYNVSEKELKVYAEKQLEELKFTGYVGNFTAMGAPSVQKGDIATIEGDKYHPSGSYLIKTVSKTSGLSGYKQTITLDQQLTGF